jgi:hypothetical protein
MNQDVAEGMRHLQSFMPTYAERRQTRLENALESANKRLTAAQAQGRNTAIILQQIDRLETELDLVINAIWLLIIAT